MFELCYSRINFSVDRYLRFLSIVGIGQFLDVLLRVYRKTQVHVACIIRTRPGGDEYPCVTLLPAVSYIINLNALCFRMKTGYMSFTCRVPGDPLLLTFTMTGGVRLLGNHRWFMIKSLSPSFPVDIINTLDIWNRFIYVYVTGCCQLIFMSNNHVHSVS